jgi:hypothetical protein
MLGINAPSGFGGSFFEAHNNGGSALFTMDTTGYLSLSTGIRGNASATTVSYIGGRDVTTTSPGGATLRGGDVTGGTTASLTPGSTTVRGGDNASSGATENGGSLTMRGGDTTNASSAVNAPGSVTIRAGNTSSTGLSTAGTLTINGGSILGAATNVAGGDITVGPGLGTGNAQPGHTKLQSTTFSGTSGITAQTAVTAYVVHKKAGSNTSATATNMFQISVAANQTVGVEVIVHVETTQATPHNCSTTETFVLAVQNTSSTVTQASTAGSTASICDAGTLTLSNTTTAFTTANPAVFKVTPSWTTIVPTAVIITVEVHNLSQQDISLL